IYSPIIHPENVLKRRNMILSMMGKQHFLSTEDVVMYKRKTLGLNVQQLDKEPAYATYIDMVLDEAEKKYHLSNKEIRQGGYTIVVSINELVQKEAYQLFQDGKYFPGTDKQVEGAFVLMDNKTGGLKAVVGGRKYVTKGLNRVQVKRQPGSSIKPLIVYGPA